MRGLISIFFFTLGIFLLSYPQLEKKISDSNQELLIEAFENLGNPELNEQTTLPTQANIKESASTILDGARGIVVIPKINLEMVIFEGASESSLKKGIGMIEADKEFGVNNVGLAGHRSTTYGKQFNRLDELAVKDIVEVKTEARDYEYEVTKIFVVDQKEVDVLKDGHEPLLTLVTCTPVGKRNPPDRLIVQAKLITKQGDSHEKN